MSALPGLVQAVAGALTASPMLWPFVTFAAFVIGKRIQSLCGGAALVNPVLIGIAITACLLLACQIPYAVYFQKVQIIHLLLGPATVALAVPLARNLHHLGHTIKGLVIGLFAGGVLAMVSAVGIVWLMGAPRLIGLTIAPKSVTTPIAMGLAEEIGGIPALTTVMVIASGIVAASIGESLFKALKVRDWRAEGLAAGVAGGGIGSATIAVRSGVAAAFAAVGMGLNGVLTTILTPLVPLIWK